MTIEQAKENLQFQAEVSQQQGAEIGALNTEKIALMVSLERKNKRIKELEEALKQMVDASGEGAE